MHLPKVLIPACLLVGGLALPARALSEDLHLSRTRVLEMIDPARSTATWQSLASAVGPTEFEDGLLIVGSAEAHERVTARRFARVLQRKYGLRLILLSKIFRMTIPAFDGLIVNDRGGVVANFSMKQTESKFNFRDSLSKITNYARREWWVAKLLMHQDERAHEVTFPHAEARAHFEERVIVLRDLAKIFGVDTDRQTWMLIEFVSGLPLDPWMVDFVARRPTTWRERIPRMLVMDGDAFFDVKASRVRADALRSCEQFFGPRRRPPQFSSAVAGESVL